MKKETVPHALVGAAGVYHVVSELSRRGMIALPTIRNTKGYDIIVARSDGSGHANIDVKTSQNRVGFWPMPSSEKVCHGPNDYYVLLRWIEKQKKFEGFMLTGAEALKLIRADERSEFNKRRVAQGKKPWSAIHVGPRSNGRDAIWKEHWETWTIS
jgi:hypothetical protein